MLKERYYVFQRANMVADFALTALSVGVAHWLRNALLAPYVAPEVFTQPSRFADYAWLAYTLPFLMVGTLAYNRYYESQRVRSFWETTRLIALSAAVTTLLAMGISFLLAERGMAARSATDGELAGMASGVVGSAAGAGGVAEGSASATGAGESVSRGVLLIFPFVLVGLIGLKSLVARRLLIALRERGYNYRTVLLVGSGEPLKTFIRLVAGHPYWGYRIAGVIDDSDELAVAREEDGVAVLGGLGALWRTLDETPVDEVVFIPAGRSLAELRPFFEGCEEMGVRTRLALNFWQQTVARPVMDSFEGVPVVTYSPTLELNAALLFKHAFDRVAAGVALVALAPVFLVISALVKLTSGSWSDPIFFGQERVGLNGKPFKLWKFRSMRIGADKEVERLRALNEMSGPVFKIKADPRVTRVGKILRKTSLDELPQFWNVLRGEMSLVGPRPPLPNEVAKYDRWQRRRLSMKPGLTCLWQVMGRNKLSFETWMKLDLEYIDNWSLSLDARILARTVVVVATGHGAM